MTRAGRSTDALAAEVERLRLEVAAFRGLPEGASPGWRWNADRWTKGDAFGWSEEGSWNTAALCTAEGKVWETWFSRWGRARRETRTRHPSPRAAMAWCDAQPAPDSDLGEEPPRPSSPDPLQRVRWFAWQILCTPLGAGEAAWGIAREVLGGYVEDRRMGPQRALDELEREVREAVAALAAGGLGERADTLSAALDRARVAAGALTRRGHP